MYKVEYADVSDAGILGEIHAASWKEAYKGIVPDEILKNISPERREKYFEKALAEGWEQDAIIYKDGEPAGMICIGRCRDTDRSEGYGEIWGIYLKPEFWHMGIGSELIKWGTAELKKQGYRKVCLWVLKDNHSARAFYEKTGFLYDGTEKEITLGKMLLEIRYEKSFI